MKITDLSVTLFKWEGIPTINYSPLSGKIGGESDLGLVTISTDEGLKVMHSLAVQANPQALTPTH